MLPRTSFEQTGAWTTYQEEQDFIAQIVAETDAEHQVLGQTDQGRNMDLITLGTGDRDPFLITGGMHGTEPAGREAALIHMRDWAYSDDSRLETHRMAWLPTINPDGTAAGERRNSNNVDPQGQNLVLEEAEGQAVNLAVRLTDPLVIADLHEISNANDNVWIAGSNNRYGHVDVMRYVNLMTDNGFIRMTEDGQGVRRFNDSSRHALRQIASYRHCVGLLIETSWTGDPAEQRVNNHLALLDTWVGRYFTNHTAIAAAKQASIDYALSSTEADVHALAGTSLVNQNSYRTVWIDGYQLSDPIPEKYVEAFDIHIEGSFVPIRQYARGVLPLLLDPESTTRIVNGAERVGGRSPSGPTAHSSGTGIFLQIGDTRRKITSAWIQGDGLRQQIG